MAAIAAGDTVTFDANSPAAAAVTTSAAISCATMTFAAGFTGSLTMSNSLTSSGAVTVTQGTLNVTSQTCSWGSLSSSNSNTRALNITNANISITQNSGTLWSIGITTGMTFTATGSTITFTNTSANAKTFTCGAGLTYGTWTLPAGGGSVTFNNPATFTAINVTGPKSIILQQGMIKTVGTLTLTGSASNLITITSNLGGTQASINVTGSSSVQYVDFKDTNASGLRIYDQGGHNTSNNTNISFVRFANTATRTLASTRSLASTRTLANTRTVVGS